MNQFSNQLIIKTVNGSTFRVEELRQVAVSKKTPGNPVFILYETPREEYLKLIVPDSGTEPLPAEMLPSETFYKVLLQDNVVLN